MVIKAYVGKSLVHLAMEIEPGISRDSLWCLPDSANLVSVNWGIFNFTFVGAPIDISTEINLAEINRARLFKDSKSLTVLQVMPC